MQKKSFENLVIKHFKSVVLQLNDSQNCLQIPLSSKILRSYRRKLDSQNYSYPMDLCMLFTDLYQLLENLPIQIDSKTETLKHYHTIHSRKGSILTIDNHNLKIRYFPFRNLDDEDC